MVQPQQDIAQDAVEVIGLQVTPGIDHDKPFLRFCAVTRGPRDDARFDIEIVISGAKAELDPSIGPTGHEPGYSDGPKWCTVVQTNDAGAVLFGQAVVKQNKRELARFQFLRLDLVAGSPPSDLGKALGVLIRPLFGLKTDGKPYYVTFCRRIGGPTPVSRDWIKLPREYRLAGEPIAVGTSLMEEAPPMVLLIRIDDGIQDQALTTLASYEHSEGSTRTGIVWAHDGQRYFALLTTRLWDGRYCLVQPT